MDVKTKELNIYFDSYPILKNIGIHVTNNEFVGVIGPNGSGKSTLLKTIYRTLQPKTGAVYINDINIEEYKFKETAKLMSVVAQQNEIQFDLTVMDMVLLGRSPHKKFFEKDNAQDYKIVEEALIQVDMQDYAHRSFLSLSGGEKQRTILARALAQKPQCLILDEPTNHLDIKHQLQIMGIAKKLGITVISAIHDLNIAAMYCDKIYALEAGEIKAFGTPKEVLTKANIKALYHVDCKILNDNQTGILHILYNPLE